MREELLGQNANLGFAGAQPCKGFTLLRVEALLAQQRDVDGIHVRVKDAVAQTESRGRGAVSPDCSRAVMRSPQTGKFGRGIYLLRRQEQPQAAGP